MNNLQNRAGLPDALLDETRFFELYGSGKTDTPSGWNNPENWKSIDNIPEDKYFGFAIGNSSNYLLIDGDHVRDPRTGKLVPWVNDVLKRVLTRAETYTEISMSGTGIHMICDLGEYADCFEIESNRDDQKLIMMNPGDYAKLPKAKMDTIPKIELYYHLEGKYVYLTGNHKRLIQVAKDDQAAAIFREILEIRKELHLKFGYSSLAAAASDAASSGEAPAPQFPIDDATRERVLAALPYISGDVDMLTWVHVGMALYNCGFSLKVWDDWSQFKDQRTGEKSAKYVEGDTAKRWKGFGKGNWNAGTIINLAKENGFMTASDKNDEQNSEAGPDNNVQTATSSAATLKAINVGEYLLDGEFDADIQYFTKYKDRKTGFSNIDEYLTLYPGLAVLGGASSLGKTTFAVNLADNLLIRGETVLYFTLEQSPFEITSKSIACAYRKNYPVSTLTNIDICNGASSPELHDVMVDYARRTANRYFVIKGDFKTTVDVIRDTVIKCKQSLDVNPVVIIDYLQLIAPLPEYRGDARGAIDENIKALKDMQQNGGLFVLLLSNFNRSSYDKPVSYESFKESGLIEYTCDYVFGLQLSVVDVDNRSYYSRPERTAIERDIARRKMIDEAMKEKPKRVEFISLKNRKGRQFFKCFFLYEPQHDRFIEASSPDRYAGDTFITLDDYEDDVASFT